MNSSASTGRTLPLIMVMGLIAISCSGRDKHAAEPAPAQTPATVGAKQGAPVKASASIDDGTAVIRVSFGRDGSDLVLRVDGVDGASIDPGATTRHEWPHVGAGESHEITVTYAIDAEGRRPQLALFVEGTFAGKPQSRAFSFSVAPADAEAGLSPGGADGSSIQTDSRGRKVHVMPAN